jgi:hypothetical protein
MYTLGKGTTDRSEQRSVARGSRFRALTTESHGRWHEPAKSAFLGVSPLVRTR